MQIETDNYYSKTIETTFQVNNKANPNLYNFNIPSKTFEDEPFTIPFPPTSNNMEGLFTYSSSNESVATIYGNTITIVGAGETIITATQEETINYNSEQITTSFTVNKASPNRNNFVIRSEPFELVPFTIPFPPTSNNMEGLFTYSSSNESVATIYGNTITIVDAGETIIAATQQETSNYNLETIVTLFEVNESTETSPTVIESDLEYFLNSTATYGNIINSIIIETELLTSSYKIIFSNNKNNKIIKIIR
jgi:hypothetical protein